MHDVNKRREEENAKRILRERKTEQARMQNEKEKLDRETRRLAEEEFKQRRELVLKKQKEEEVPVCVGVRVRVCG